MSIRLKGVEIECDRCDSRTDAVLSIERERRFVIEAPKGWEVTFKDGSDYSSQADWNEIQEENERLGREYRVFCPAHRRPW